jgi:hypothetical protein
MMVVFKHAYFREVSIRRGPIEYMGSRLTLIRHEEAEFWVICPYVRNQMPVSLRGGGVN